MVPALIISTSHNSLSTFAALPVDSKTVAFLFDGAELRRVTREEAADQIKRLQIWLFLEVHCEAVQFQPDELRALISATQNRNTEPINFHLPESCHLVVVPLESRDFVPCVAVWFGAESNAEKYAVSLGVPDLETIRSALKLRTLPPTLISDYSKATDPNIPPELLIVEVEDPELLIATIVRALKSYGLTNAVLSCGTNLTNSGDRLLNLPSEGLPTLLLKAAAEDQQCFLLPSCEPNVSSTMRHILGDWFYADPLRKSMLLAVSDWCFAFNRTYGTDKFSCSLFIKDKRFSRIIMETIDAAEVNSGTRWSKEIF